MLASGKPDFPFCLCWASENWTRRWDGQEREVLMAQVHDAESDIAFLHSVLPYFRDPRYIRVGGRPLLVINSTALFPELGTTVNRWRSEMERLGEFPLYLVAAESLNLNTASVANAGFDATCEFPPHGAVEAVLPRELWPTFSAPFSGLVLDYERMVEQFLSKPQGALRRLKTVTLNWDNTARKKSAAHLMAKFSLAAYHRWLSGAINFSELTAPPSEQFVFINAWNEWAEGTYLEPDQLHGNAYLEATRAAILGQEFRTHHHIAPDDKPSSAPEYPPTQLAATTPSLAAAPPCSAGRLKLVGIAMVGNEADIIEAFVRENCRYLDHLMVADHNSLDGTREILAELVAEGLPITVERIEAIAYAQTAVTNRLLGTALEKFAPDWIFPLDADEVLDAASRAALEDELAGIPGQHGCIAWITHVPTAFDDSGEQHPLRRIAHRYAYPIPDPRENPPVWKLVINASLFGPYTDRYAIEKGSHRIVFRDTNEPSGQPVRPLVDVRLRHFPVRSYDQLATKIGIGVPQKLLSVSKLDQAGIQWPLMWRAMLEGRCDISLLQSACRQYLDTGRKSAEETVDVPIVLDPLVVHHELHLGHHRIPVPGIFIRWIGMQLQSDRLATKSASRLPDHQVDRTSAGGENPVLKEPSPGGGIRSPST
jgi:hypothetical protein